MYLPADVFAGRSRWSAICADCCAWADSLPDDSLDVFICSPPYEARRTYSIGFNKRGEVWVAWMKDLVLRLLPKVKGSIFIVCEGETKNYSYSCVPDLLIADLKRAGVTFRKTLAYHRVGIPGGGGQASQHADYDGSADGFRNDWEPILWITRGGKLPYADTLACGYEPKWGPGGEMSYRLTDGTRRNQWGANTTSSARRPNGKREKSGRPGHIFETVGETKRKKKHTKPKVIGGKDVDVEQTYEAPTIANPGNVIQEIYTSSEVVEMLKQSGNLIHCKVGGGLMGSDLAHKNEAPYPEQLVRYLIKSFTKPGHVVADCFLGSGTTAAVALKFGCRFVGCDERQDQVDIAIRRIKEEATGLFD